MIIELYSLHIYMFNLLDVCIIFDQQLEFRVGFDSRMRTSETGA